MTQLRDASSFLTAQEALERSVHIKDADDLLAYLGIRFPALQPTRENVTVTRWRFDDRLIRQTDGTETPINWDTHTVAIDGVRAVFLDGPIDGLPVILDEAYSAAPLSQVATEDSPSESPVPVS